jgi:hypothetical protein
MSIIAKRHRIPGEKSLLFVELLNNDISADGLADSSGKHSATQLAANSRN